jgi:predicted ATPase
MMSAHRYTRRTATTMTEAVMAGLATPLTSLIGREREIAQVVELLASARLVTLTGPGGVGKTRLAQAVVDVVRERFNDGAVVVSLAALTDPALVLPTIAHAVDMPDTGDQPIVAQLCSRLEARHLLLVLDNFEHVSDAALTVAALLECCLQVTILATSRMPLRLQGERLFSVPPLALAARTGAISVADLAQQPAIALFVERAQAAAPDFRLTAQYAPIVAEICRQLDGLPLAIELAAARVRIIAPHTLLAQLEQRLRVLTGGPRDAPARQRTMRNTIAWSYDLLSSDQQDVCRQLAVFVDGWTLDAMLSVCAVPRDAPAAFDLLASLLDKSLIYQRDGVDGARRFCMLETIRAFALEQLSVREESAAVFARHADYYLALSASNGALLFAARPAQLRAVAEQGNLLAALHWWMRHG